LGYSPEGPVADQDLFGAWVVEFDDLIVVAIIRVNIASTEIMVAPCLNVEERRQSVEATAARQTSTNTGHQRVLACGEA